MEPRRYFSLRSRFADTTSPLPMAILIALSALVVIGILIDIANT